MVLLNPGHQGIIRMIDAAMGTQVRELKGGHNLDVQNSMFGPVVPPTVRLDTVGTCHLML